MDSLMRARIVGQNETSAAFGAVARDAQASGNAVAASGRTAAAGLKVEASALNMLQQSSRQLRQQQANLIFQLNDIGVSLAGGMNPLLVAAQQGSQIATIWGPEEGGLGRAFKETGNLAVGMVSKFWPVAAAVAAIGVGVGALTTEINRNQKQQVSWTDVVAASWQLASEEIVKSFQPVIDTVGGWWDAASPFIADGINKAIGIFNFGVKAIGSVWGVLPGVIGEAMWNAAQGTVNGVVWMVREVQTAINGLIVKANSALGTSIGQLELMGYLDLGSNPFGGVTGDLTSGLQKSWSDAMGTDYLALIGERARAIAAANAAADKGTSNLDKAVKGPLTDGIDKLTAKTNAFADAATSAFSNLGSGLIGAFKKGGNVAGNVLDMLLGKVGQFGESLLNSGLNGLLNLGVNALVGALTPTGGAWGNGLWGSAIFSADGGGWTGGGPRAGGLDGKGGFLSLLHPQETVVDHTRGGMAAGTVINFNISGSRQDAATIARSVEPVARRVFLQMQRNPDRG